MPDQRPSSLAMRLRRHPERARHDRETLNEILDEGLICHLGFVVDGRPMVLPTIHARVDDLLYIHGSSASRMQKHLREGADCCVTVTLVDELVMARSAFNHSMNYRSAVVVGRAAAVTDPGELEIAYGAIVDHVARGRWVEVRWPTPKEAKATSILRLPIEEYSCKVRTGPPKDEEEDLALDVWAGVVPVRVATGDPEPSPDLRPGVALPHYLNPYKR